MSVWVALGLTFVVLFGLLSLMLLVMLAAALMDFGSNPHLHGLYGNGGYTPSAHIY